MFDYMLDTDICSYIIRQRPIAVLEKFETLERKDCCISSVTQAELLFGVAKAEGNKRIGRMVEDFLDQIITLNWGQAAARAYGPLRATLQKEGRAVGNLDMMIAAHALSRGSTIVTNNTRHFSQIPGVKAVNWL